MEERFKFIQDYQDDEESFAELCRGYGVSRKTGYKWVERYGAEGLDGLRDQSRAADYHPNEVLKEVADEVFEMRRRHPHWGPAKLRVRLEREAPEITWPAPSTIGEMLKRAGLTVPRKHRRRATPSQSPLSHAAAANQVWSADFKGWFRCGDGSRCDPLTMSDGYSRFLLRCQAMEGTDERSAQGVMEAAFREYGLPEAMRSDNGEPFGSVGLGGLSRLAVWWIKLGIRPERIRPGKPQENGRHERMHRSLKEATAQPPAANLRRQQESFDRFRQEYNWERPHEALQMKTPGELYLPNGRSYPARLAEPEYCGEWEVRSVGPCGTMRWRNAKPFVSKVLAGEAIGLEPVDDGEWKLWFFGHPLGIFDERKGIVRKLDNIPEGGDVDKEPANACGSKEVCPPFPVSPSGGKPGRAGSPHAAHAARQHNPLARIDAAAPPARGVSKRSADPPLANPPCGVSGACFNVGGTRNHWWQRDVFNGIKCHPSARIKVLPIHQAVPLWRRPPGLRGTFSASCHPEQRPVHCPAG